MISRDIYMDWLIALKDKKLIKVITGIRRCGKSTLLEQYQKYLLEVGVKSKQIIAINFEDINYDDLRNAKSLHQYIEKLLQEGQKTYIFLDEIQQVDEFQRVVDSLYIKKNVDLYITGSNARLLSGEISTLLSGRYVEVQMLPLSFKEFAGYYKEHTSLAELYTSYLEFSSFPYALELDKNKKLIRNYLDGVFNSVVLKDVVARNKIGDVMMLESVIRFLFDNIGNTCSIKKISDTMTSMGRKISTHTVEVYIKALMDSFIIYQAKRFDIKGKQYLKTLEKYYVVDIGLRYYLLGNKNVDAGHILENVVYLELIRRGYDVYIGKVDDLEVDFIATLQNETLYIQVSATTRDKTTLERELRPFNKVKNNYPKILLTLDEEPDSDYDGVRKTNALKFLME